MVTSLSIRMLFPWIVAVVVAIAVVVLVVVLARMRAKDRERNDGRLRCARCGYVVEHLEIPACPECGSVTGFKRSFDEEKGISPINSIVSAFLWGVPAVGQSIQARVVRQ